MLRSFGALLALLFALSTSAAELNVDLPGHDALVLVVPDGWVAQVRRPKADLPPTVVVTSNAANTLQVLISPIWPMGSEHSPTPDVVRRLVESAARQAQPQAAEKDLPLRRFAGKGTSGYYFSATDREPEPNGYKYLTQGALVLNELCITFTILVNGEPQKPTDKALEMLRAARRAPAKGAT